MLKQGTHKGLELRVPELDLRMTGLVLYSKRIPVAAIRFSELGSLQYDLQNSMVKSLRVIQLKEVPETRPLKKADHTAPDVFIHRLRQDQSPGSVFL